MNKNNTKKYSRRLLTATMATVLTISLSSCTASNNSIDSTLSNEVYASTGDISITKGELWNELQWDSSDVLETQIENVVLNSYTKKITTIMNKNYSDLTSDDKELLSLTDKEEKDFTNLKTKYQERLVDYVIKDIYNFNYSSNHYYSNMISTGKETLGYNEVKYFDSIYSTYFITISNLESNGKKLTKDYIAEIRNNIIANENNEDKQNEYASNLLVIATTVSEKYYPLLAKELLALDKVTEKADEQDKKALEDDDESEYFAESEWASKFLSEYVNDYNLNMVLIHFASDDEYNDTLRAFGLKIYNKKLYYIGATEETQKMTYDEYCDYYDDFSNSDLTRTNDDVINLSDNSNKAVILELYVQMYNYSYGEYVTKEQLSASYSHGVDSTTTIDDLRGIALDIATSSDLTYEETKDQLLSNSKDSVVFTSTYIKSLSSSLATYFYETLTEDSPFSTSTQSATSGCYIAYKFGDELDTTNDYGKWYAEEERANSDIYDYIHEEGHEDLLSTIREKLIIAKLDSEDLDDYVEDLESDAKIKIYNEACEIAYSKDHTDYSKALGKAPNSNVLATIEYDGVTYNLNIVADSNDEKTIYYPGTTTPVGVFDYLEKTTGATTAIDLLSTKMIKQTKAYEETGSEENVKDYKEYLEYILYAFANDNYSSSGYSSSIGKYNFLMLYYHSANIDDIINNYYRVQYASANLLTDYSNDAVINFFKTYTDLAYDKYFSLTATRLVVYYDADDDGEADDIETWANKIVEFEGDTVLMEQVAKSLVYEIYNKISASSDAHADKLSDLVEEINDSAKAEYSNNIIAPENVWAKYKKLGLNVKTEEITATNSSTDIDWNIKNRLYQYATTDSYEFYINSTAPSVYMEILNKDDITQGNKIIQSDDGYNLLLVTEGSAPASAKWESKDNQDKIMENIIVKYNEKYYKISDIYNEDDKLNTNQIKLYVLDYMTNSSSTLSPSSTSDALSNFLSPVVTRFTSSETQRIVLLSFMKAFLVNDGKTEYSNKNLYEIVTFNNTSYNGSDGVFAKIIEINQNSADSYNSYYVDLDISGTVDTYSGNGHNWWTELEEQIASFLTKEDNE